MIIHRDIIQGSDAWLGLRLGIPTCSNFDRILTPSQLKFAAGAKTYAVELALERLWGKELDNASTLEMVRGTDLESTGINWCSFEWTVDIDRVGFITDDENSIGGSPDGLIGDDGMVEIKTPMAVKHAMYAVYGGLEKKHRGQVQGLLLLTGRKWCNLVSFNPRLEPIVVRVERDEEYIRLITEATRKFDGLLVEACQRLDVPSDWRERIQARSDERAKLEAEERKYFPPQDAVEDPDLEARRKWLNEQRGRKHATDTQVAFEAGGRVR